MQNEKTEIKNRILTEMRNHLTSAQYDMLGEAIVYALRDMEVTREKTELATVDNSNDHILEMFAAVKGQHLSQKTLKFYMYTANRFLDVVHKSLVTVDAIDIELFMHHMRKTNSNASVNNHLRNLSALFRWLVIQRIIPMNPCDLVEPLKEIQKPIDRLTLEEFDRMRSACKSLRDRCLIEFLRCTALRTEELAELTVGAVDYQNGSILTYIPKQRKYRTVFLDKLTMGYLREYTEGADAGRALFIGKQKKPLSANATNKALHRIGKLAGIHKNVYVHMMRRTCATHILERGGSIEEAGIYLGHRPATVTGKHYTDYGEAYIKRIFDKYVAAA